MLPNQTKAILDACLHLNLSGCGFPVHFRRFDAGQSAANEFNTRLHRL